MLREPGMAKHDNENNNQYTASSIKVMEGLEAVRKRPAMYIGSTGPQGLHHLVYEIVDNSVDEALAGYCDTVNVTLHADGSCSVEDNGRGIPVDIHPTEKVSAAEVVLTKLHAGGKFDKDTYKFSGGLHGVGVSVVNALSSRLDLTIYKNGKIHFQAFERGNPLDRLKIIGDTDKRGTTVRFWPDSEIFRETTALSFDTLSARLRELAFLNKGLRITITDEAQNKSHEFYFEGGIVSFVQHINNKKIPLFPEVIHLKRSDESYELEVAMQYNDGYGEQLLSFVNNINTVEGGTHVSGFRSALTKLSNKKGTEFGIIKDAEGFSSEDVREGLVCVINLKVPEPQFEGQTKTKLGNSDVKGLVDSWCFAFLDTYFEEHPAIARKILLKADTAKRAREAAKKARDLTRRKTVLESSVLPGKLADCSNDVPSECELFIVEGDSAGGSAKGARDRANQAVLPLRGKILNVEKARLDKILSNEEIKALIAAIGCGIGTDMDANKARYHKIILMTDADVDGSHIRTLLLTLFFRYMPGLIEKGYIYIAQPPLYKAKIGKKEQYLKEERSFKQFLIEWAKEQTELIINEQPSEPNVWAQILSSMFIYESKIDHICRLFHIPYGALNVVINCLSKEMWDNTTGVSGLITLLSRQLPEYYIGVQQKPADPEEALVDDTAITENYITLSYLNTTWNLPVDLFRSSDLHEALEHYKYIAPYLTGKWSIKVSGKDRMLSGQGITSIVPTIKELSKPYLHIQRYKGLGEMNPDQLGETAMSPATRSLLQVTIQDAVQADTWFTTLMGDDVSGRKDYIEQFGQFVKNLDV